LEERQALTVSMVIDYSHDAGNFFDTQAKRDLLQLAADTIVNHFSDDLAAIVPGPSGFGFDNSWSHSFYSPGTGTLTSVADATIPADTILVYAGGRDLTGSTLGVGGPGGWSASGTQAWLNTVAARGEPGALASPKTDFGPWGGSIAFTTNGSVNWHFGATTTGLDANEADFLTVAMHELVHLLGFGISPSWTTLVDTATNTFTGSSSAAEFDGAGDVPLDSHQAHWADGVQDGGEATLMDPILTLGTRSNLTALDLAGLADIGWQLAGSDLVVLNAEVSDGATLSVTYEVRGTDVSAFDLSVVLSPDGLFDAGDTSLLTATISDAADLLTGVHTKVFTLGSGVGELPLPGREIAETDDDYDLLVVVDSGNAVVESDVDPFNSDNTTRIAGVYLGSDGTTVYVHGTRGDDTISVATDKVVLNGVDHTISSSTATSMRFRAGAGDDAITAGDIAAWLRGGTGNDTLTGGSQADTLYGDAGNDSLQGGNGDDLYRFDADADLDSDTIADTSGMDHIDYSSTTALGVTLNLGVTTQQVVNANHRITFASASSMNRLTGTPLADTLTGNSEANVLVGLAGNDTLSGGGGDDVYPFDADTALGVDSIADGSGVDVLDFSQTTGLSATVNLSLTTQQVVNANLSLRFLSNASIENIVGTPLNDTLTGNTLANTFTGGGGDDTLTGGAGADTYVFDADDELGKDTISDSAGMDRLDFAASDTGVVVNLGVTTVQTLNPRLQLVLTSGAAIEDVTGSTAADQITGNTLVNTLAGGGGNDQLSGLGANDVYVFDADTNLGSDTIADSAGTDRIDFSGTTSEAIVFNLGLATPQVVNANLTLALVGGAQVEQLTGGALGDTLTGNGAANLIDGGDGSDTLAGGNGNDTLVGGAGDDVLNGQAGNDVYVFDADASLGSDSISDSAGTDTISYATTSTVGATLNLSLTTAQVVNGNHTLTLPGASVIENVEGGAGSDTLTGNSLANRITGGAGDDVLEGAAGGDTFVFDADAALGSDTLSDASGSDTLDFAATTTRSIALDLGLTSTQTVNNFLSLTLTSDSAFENVFGGGLGDTLTGNGLANLLQGNAGNDTLLGGDGDDRLMGGAGTDSLNGNAGHDAYLFDIDVALGADTVVDTEGGIDWLDFTGTTKKSVVVDLSSTSAQNLGAGSLSLTLSAGSSLEAVLGGTLADTLTGNSLANVLVGGAGNDTLSGGDGRDLLLGGAGADTLTGGVDEDLLIAGTTSYDALPASLVAILAEWDSADDYATRQGRLRAGTGVPRLAATVTVKSDGSAVDSLTGSADRDWYFAALAEVTDKAADESVDVL
jgi:Ca2+-binding RTX toxin-like protein